MEQYLIQHQGMLEGLCILGLVVIATFFVVYIRPKVTIGFSQDPMSGTRYARNPEDRL